MAHVVDYWNEQARTFDEAPDHGLRDPRVRAAWADLLLPLLPSPPAQIADLGCGTGSLALLLASAGHAVRGLDLAPAMIDLARDKAAAAGVALPFVVGDAARPPWPDASLDAVLCRHVLWALDDRAGALAQWLRMLKPTGRLLLIEGLWSTGAGMPASAIVDLLASTGRGASVRSLPDPVLWGRPISDDRYLIVSPAAPVWSG